jgi:hypothetical protein
MATFRKFAFPNQATADKLLQALQPLDTAVPLGELDGLVCYDILFQDACPASLNAYIVWPAPCGVHSFLGWDAQYEADYQEFATPNTK